jgi:hypothetical protein
MVDRKFLTEAAASRVSKGSVLIGEGPFESNCKAA